MISRKLQFASNETEARNGWWLAILFRIEQDRSLGTCSSLETSKSWRPNLHKAGEAKNKDMKAETYEA